MTPPPDPGPIMGLITAYWGSQTLFAANELGVFTALAAGPVTPEALASKLGVDARALRHLLQALGGLGLLRAENGRFANAPAAATYLVEGGSAYLGNAIRYGADHYGLWGGLAEVVRRGRPAAEAESYLGADPDRTRHFVWGMHARAMGVARAVTRAIDLPPDTRLLDLGGGPGTYAALLAQKTPGLRAIVFDLPPIVAIAREIIASLGVADRVQTEAGDFLHDPYPSGMGAALLSGILHREPADTCRAIIGRVHASLTPGGTIVLSDVMLGADRVSPPFSTLFGLHMVVTSERGGAHATDEHETWLREAGFADVTVRQLPPPAPHTVITALKRGA